MQPQQPYYPPAPAPAPPPPGPGQYDFITGGSYQQPGSYGNQNPKKMILVVVIGAVVVIGLIWLILSLVFGGGSGDKLTPLIGIAQQQTELVRITDAATDGDDISGQDVKNVAENTKLTLSTDKADMVSFMGKNGLKVKDKELSATQSSQTDSTLDAAKANGTYDSTLLRVLQDELKTYQGSLKQAYAGTSSQAERDVLSTQYENAGLLLEQAEQHN